VTGRVAVPGSARPGDGPFRCMWGAEVSSQLDSAQVMAAVRSAFTGLAHGTSVQPGQTIVELPDSGSDCIFYPAVISDPDLIGVKVSPYLAARATAGKAPVTAYTLVLSARTGEPMLLCDSLALTAARTAATTALAVELLSRPLATSLSVIGAGTIALEHIRYVATVRDWSRITVFSPALADPGHPYHALRYKALAELPVEASVARSAAEAAREADVVLLCTSSAEPVTDVSSHRTDGLITSISTSSKFAAEIDPSELAGLQVFCDYRKTAAACAGDFLAAAAMGAWQPCQIVADLPELLSGAAVPLARCRRYFRSTGLGIEDLAIARLLLTSA
jgi:L-arginine dehydrogenase